VRTAIARHQESRAIHWMKNFQEESSQRFYRDFLLKIFPCMWGTNSVYIGGVCPTESKEFKLFIVLINSSVNNLVGIKPTVGLVGAYGQC
jgi:hypothetical protein